jgi:hypothetical protein
MIFIRRRVAPTSGTNVGPDKASSIVAIVMSCYETFISVNAFDNRAWRNVNIAYNACKYRRRRRKEEEKEKIERKTERWEGRRETIENKTAESF